MVEFIEALDEEKEAIKLLADEVKVFAEQFSIPGIWLHINKLKTE